MRLSRLVCSVVCAGVLAAGSAALAGVSAADSYELTWIGLPGAQFIDNTGKVYAEGYQIANNNLVLGRNRIYYGGSANLGDAWWVSDGTTTNRVGLFDAAHTKTSNGYQKTNVIAALSSALGFQANGRFVFGESEKYKADGTVISSTPWVYDTTTNTTIGLGLTGALYTHADGYTSPSRWEGGENGNFAGMNTLWNGGTTNMGTAGWIYNYSTGTTTRVGLTGAQYVRSDGYERVSIGRVSQGGDHVFGRSYAYSGMTGLGTDAFRYDVDTATTVQIGLTGPGYTRADGYREVEIRRSNAAGQLSGLSKPYSGSTDMGRLAWLFDGTNTIAIGPSGAQFVRSDGYRMEETQPQITATGHVAGQADTYIGATFAGNRAWFYDGTTTRVLPGLQGGVFVKPNGHYAAIPVALNESDQITGTSYRYTAGGASIGLQGWFYDAASDTTVALGLTDPAYTQPSDGKQYHYPSALSPTGMVLGASDRYDGLFSKGYWVYDWQTQQTYELALSTKSNGYYNNVRRDFTNDGDGVVGYHEVFEADVSQGYSLYYWTIDRSTNTPVWVDLSDITTLEAAESLYSTVLMGSCGMNSGAYFTGTGTMPNGSRGAYLLTPVSTAMPGDFDGDDDVDADDIDLLCDNLGNAAYDLDGDDDADEDDMTYLIVNLVELTDGVRVGTKRGDFNLDGLIDATDLAILGSNFSLSAIGYAGGNANCDDLVDATDLAILAGDFGYTRGPGAVPEPITMGLLGLGGLSLLGRRSRK